MAYPNVLVLLGGSMELIHLRRRGVADEEHASLLIGYIPHYQVLKGHYWRFILDHAVVDFFVESNTERHKKRSQNDVHRLLSSFLCKENPSMNSAIV